MIRVTVSGSAPNRSPSIGGRTLYLRGGSVELLEDELALELQAWSSAEGHASDYRFDRASSPPPPPPAPAPEPVVLSDAEARKIIGPTRGVTRAELRARVEEAGFELDDEALAAAKSKTAFVSELVTTITGA